MVISVVEFLAKQGIPVVPQLPYSPDLSPCDFFFFFFFFQKLNFRFIGAPFGILEKIEKAVTDQLKRFQLATSSAAMKSGNVSGDV